MNEVEIRVSPEEAQTPEWISRKLNHHLGLPETTQTPHYVRKRSIDARKKPAVVVLKVVTGEWAPPFKHLLDHKDISQQPVIHIIGAGPAGLFAALRVIELGFKPVIFERGKDVKARRRDLAAITKMGLVNPESNYCFGEGGAGTYSDGKLYTRSTKRGSVERILAILVQFGASRHIAVEAHPHIGTNKLPAIIAEIRQFIERCGGEVHFEKKLTGIHHQQGQIHSIALNNGETIRVKALILATGHSARDIFYLLHQSDIRVESKPFAIGVRAEHDQRFVDQCQYKANERGDYLPPAAYSLVSQVDGRGVFSFCMCPGGIIAPCATEPGEIVTNGWSPSKRNNPYANSGIVVAVDQLDFKKYGFEGPLAGLEYQKMIEKKCWEAVADGQKAPAQRMVDFVKGRKSPDLPKCSYQPGVVSSRLDLILPSEIAKRLQQAFVDFGKKMPGYLSNDAILVAPESRTSSPVRIPRDAQSLMHPDVMGLFPCGEGAGYAGGIVSAAIDGENCATAAFQLLSQTTEKQ